MSAAGFPAVRRGKDVLDADVSLQVDGELTNADIGDVQAHWIDEHDPYVNAMGSKGIGEIGIVGTAAAVANAAWHATGVRVRDLPITLDKLLPAE